MNLNCTKASNGRTPLLLLCNHNKADNLCDLIEVLLNTSKVDFTIKDQYGSSTMTTVCSSYRGKGLLKIVQLFARLKVDVDTASRAHGRNALYALCTNLKGETLPSLLDLVKVLIECKIDANARSKDNDTVLTALILNHHRNPNIEEVVRLLTERGQLNINLENDEGRNVLLNICADYKNGEHLFKMTKILVDCGVNIHCRDRSGKSALCYLRAKNKEPHFNEIIEFLSNRK